jgi:hypothetical protein
MIDAQPHHSASPADGQALALRLCLVSGPGRFENSFPPSRQSVNPSS